MHREAGSGRGLHRRAPLVPGGDESGSAASVCFYATDIHKGTLGAGGDDSLARAAEIRGELQMVWGRQDPHVPPEGRAKILARLAEVEARFTWHEYNAQHAFLRDEGPRYDPAAALLCYRQALELFGRKLGEGDVE